MDRGYKLLQKYFEIAETIADICLPNVIAILGKRVPAIVGTSSPAIPSNILQPTVNRVEGDDGKRFGTIGEGTEAKALLVEAQRKPNQKGSQGIPRDEQRAEVVLRPSTEQQRAGSWLIKEQSGGQSAATVVTGARQGHGVVPSSPRTAWYPPGATSRI